MAVERLKITWTPPGNGVAIEFSDEPLATYFLCNIYGFLANRATPVMLRAPGQRGFTLSDVTVESRTLAIQSWVSAETANGLWAARELLGGSFAVEPSSVETPELGLLTIERPGYPTREIQVLPVDSPQDEFLTETAIQADIEFIAPYPYFRAADDNTEIFVPTGGFEWPIEWPIEFEFSGVVTSIDNVGTVSVPVLIRIDGEIDTPRIENVTTGKVLELDLVIGAGEYVIIDTSFAHKTAILYPGEANVIQTVNLDLSDFWSLRPGLNELRFGSVGIGTGAAATVTWRSEWAGI